MFESRNPLLKEDAMNKNIRSSGAITYEDTMTVDGAVNKTLVLFCLLMITAVLGFKIPSQGNIILGAIGGFIALLVGIFKPRYAPIAAPVYALFEGLFVGAISAMYAQAYEGIITQAVLLTFGTLVAMLGIYKTGLIEVNHRFKMGVFMATGAIALTYLMSFIGSFFGMSLPYLHQGGMLGIGVSVVIIIVASLNLLIDFDAFEKGEQAAAPKYMEWLCAMGLMVTLIWLYIEFLRLLSKLNRD